MAEENKVTKKCKFCKSEINKAAKVCPHCRKKQSGGTGCIIAIVVGFILLVGAAGGSQDSSSTSSTVHNNTAANNVSVPEEPEVIEYIPCTVEELMDALDKNSAAASLKYKGQYLEVTGKLSTIDSDLKYISITPDKDFAILGVHCSIKNDAQKQAILNMTSGDIITVKGKCTDVGEIIAYNLDIDEIE